MNKEKGKTSDREKKLTKALQLCVIWKVLFFFCQIKNLVGKLLCGESTHAESIVLENIACTDKASPAT